MDRSANTEGLDCEPMHTLHRHDSPCRNKPVYCSRAHIRWAVELYDSSAVASTRQLSGHPDVFADLSSILNCSS